MAFVITKNCEGVCDTACVDVCPVDCIHPTKEEWSSQGYDPEHLEGKQLYINPEECIDCGACEPACPVQAIFPEDEVPFDMVSYIDKNKAWYGL